MGKFIAKCTPSLGQVSIWWSRCTETVLWSQNSDKAIFYLRDKVGGEIGEVRNGIVDAVLKFDESQQVSDLLWIDDDVLVFPGALLELLRVRELTGAPVVSGVYFTKREDRLSTPLIMPSKRGGTDPFIPNRQYPVWGHGMGLTLVSLDVYKRMAAELELPRDKYNRPQWYHTLRDDEIWEDSKGTIHTEMTEDLWFCDNLAKLGVTPYVSTHKHAFGFHYESAPVIKIDPKRESKLVLSDGSPIMEAASVPDAEPGWYRVPIIDYLQWRGQKQMMDYGYPNEQWRQWISGKAISWDTPDGKVVWG